MSEELQNYKIALDVHFEIKGDFCQILTWAQGGIDSDGNLSIPLWNRQGRAGHIPTKKS